MLMYKNGDSVGEADIRNVACDHQEGLYRITGAQRNRNPINLYTGLDSRSRFLRVSKLRSKL